MDKIDWSFTIALISVAFGWLLNQLGGWFSGRAENIKIKNTVLYNLLEINYIFNQISNKELLENISERVLKELPKENQTPEAKQELINFYKNLTEPLNKTIVISKLNDIKSKYTSTIEKLASIKPFTAYRLHGKTDIIQSLDTIESFYESFLDKHSSSLEETEEIMAFFKSNLINELLSNAVNDLQKEIRLIAFSVGLITWLKVILSFRTAKKRAEIDQTKKIDEFFQKAKESLFF